MPPSRRSRPRRARHRPHEGSWSCRCSRRAIEAAHARRQYDAVDPANRLVAGELERRWNEALQAVHRIEGEIAAIEARRPPPLGEQERQQLMQLGADLELAWSHPAATAATRKRILRAALNEIVVRMEGGFIKMVLHWQGGDHTALQAEDECGRQAPLDAARGYVVADARAGAPDAGSADRAPSQSRRQADRAWQRLDRERVARSATTTTLRSTATANGPSAARSRSKRRRKS